MDAKDRKKYDDMLHDVDEKKVLLEEKRKKINENEKVWQRECREFKKMQFWSKPGAPPAPGNVPPVAWDPKLLSGLPPPAAQGVPPPLAGDSKAVEDAKNAADYAVAAALAVAGASSSKPKEDDGSGGGKESKKRKSSRSSSSRSKRKTRSVEGDVGDTAAV